MLRKGDTAVLGCENDDIMAMINKIGVILQLELNLLLGFEDDDNTALTNKEGVILELELNLQSSSSSLTRRSAGWTRRPTAHHCSDEVHGANLHQSQARRLPAAISGRGLDRASKALW